MGDPKHGNAACLSDENFRQIETMSAYGMPMKHISAIIGISERTLERMAKTDERVSDALLKGRAKAADAVYKTAWEMATSGKQPTMTIFWLKVREGWKEDADLDDLKDVVKATADNVAELTAIAKKGLPGRVA